MTVSPLDAPPLRGIASVPDVPSPDAGATGTPQVDAFARALDAAQATLEGADSAERAFARGAGGLQEMVLARAQADVMLSIATAAASHTAQALSAILTMQV